VVSTYVRAVAPVRVLDAGGWTDTWFAGHGAVCHLAVDNGSEVVVSRVAPDIPDDTWTVELRVPAFGDRYCFSPHDPPGRHPLLEATLRRWAPARGRIEVTVMSAVPPGSGLGTSASVVVALIAALRALDDLPLDAADLARAAHDVETLDLGLQSGVQDQVAAAHGGANLLSIEPYPQVAVQPLVVPARAWEALARRVLTVWLGAPHRSSAVHEAVIERLSRAGATSLLARLRLSAQHAAAALVAGDLEGYGRAMSANNQTQAMLHPGLVSPLAHQVLEVAQRHGAAGGKVNGAGGEGGSVSIVGPDDPAELVRSLASKAPLTVLPLRPARQGVRIVEHA
jgi:D-glycero-alpha-D-manno-heptose-7-phosphate kinase